MYCSKLLFSVAVNSFRLPSRNRLYFRANGEIFGVTFGLNKKCTVLLSFDSIYLNFSFFSKLNWTFLLIGSFVWPIFVSCSSQIWSSNPWALCLFSIVLAIELYIHSLKSTLSWSLKVFLQWFLSAKNCILYLKLLARKVFAMLRHYSLFIVSSYCFLLILAVSNALFLILIL